MSRDIKRCLCVPVTPQRFLFTIYFVESFSNFCLYVPNVCDKIEQKYEKVHTFNTIVPLPRSLGPVCFSYELKIILKIYEGVSRNSDMWTYDGK